MDRRKFIGFGSAALGTTFAASASGIGQLKKTIRDEKLKENFELFIHPSVLKNEQREGRIGCSAAIYISQSKKWVKKQFNPWKPAANGSLPEIKFSENPQKVFETEMKSFQSLAKLGSKSIPANVDFDKRKLTITMPYMGEDLQIQRRLFRKKEFRKEFIDFLVESFSDYQKAGFIKLSTALSNYYYHAPSKSFYGLDFKRVTDRTPANLKEQLITLKKFFGRHLREDFSQLRRLEATFSDMDQEAVKKIFDEVIA